VLSATAHERLIPSLQLGTVTLAGWQVVSVASQYVRAINRSASGFPNALVFCCVRAGPSCKLGSARRRPRVIRPCVCVSDCPGTELAQGRPPAQRSYGSAAQLARPLPRCPNASLHKCTKWKCRTWRRVYYYQRGGKLYSCAHFQHNRKRSSPQQRPCACQQTDNHVNVTTHVLENLSTVSVSILLNAFWLRLGAKHRARRRPAELPT